MQHSIPSTRAISNQLTPSTQIFRPSTGPALHCIIMIGNPNDPLKKSPKSTPVSQFYLCVLDGKFNLLNVFCLWISVASSFVMRFWILSTAFILVEIASLAESQCRRCDQTITGKGPFIHYVSTFLVLKINTLEPKMGLADLKTSSDRKLLKIKVNGN